MDRIIVTIIGLGALNAMYVLGMTSLCLLTKATLWERY